MCSTFQVWYLIVSIPDLCTLTDFVVLFKLAQENFVPRLTGRGIFRQTDRQTVRQAERQTDRWTKSKPIILFGETGRGLNMQRI